MLDVTERRLTRGRKVIRVSPKAHDVLLVLVRHAGHLVTKNELLARVWPEVFVEEGILAVHVSALRKALGDQRRPPSYVETVPRSGYRFIGAVTHEPGRVLSPSGAAQARRAV
jgi:DNA-binding winged helix-turn-helix (wHTH) protein